MTSPSILEQAQAHDAAGVAAYQSGQVEAALIHFTQASAAAPDWFQPQWHAGVCLHALRNYAAAIAAYRQALTLNPHHALLRYHLAKALKDSGDLAAAQAAYSAALQLDPDNPALRYSEGLLYLLRGDWLRGWPGYELRFAGSDRADKEHRPQTVLPRWQGDAVPGGSGIVIYAEQGMGDTLQCFRYVAALQRHFESIKFSVQWPLVSLLQANSPPGVTVVPRVAQAIDESGFTHSLDMLSLPAVFRTTPTSVPAAPYLLAPPRSSERWHERFATETRPKIGVAWQGGTLTFAPARDMEYTECAPLLARDDIAWVSLQKDCAPPAGSPLDDVSGHLADFSDTAGLIAQLDWVIAVDTAVAHLAGALGKPVWLLSRFESEWRWMHDKTETPWYPSMQIFNQPAPGDWLAAITKIRQHLERQFPSSPAPLLQNKESFMPTFLHIGCGPKRKDQTTRGFNTPDWTELRLDIDAGVNPDITGTMTDMSAVADGSVDAIFSSHNIEHLYPHEVPKALAEFKRVLKPDGFAVITCPDLQSVCALVAEDKLTEPAYTAPAGPIAPLDILYGHRPPMARGNLYMAHRCGFTQKVLDGTLRAQGFAAVASMKRKSVFDLWALASVSARSEDEMRSLAAAHFPMVNP